VTKNFYLHKERKVGVGLWLVWTKLLLKRSADEPKERRLQHFAYSAALASVRTLAAGPLR